MKLLTPFFIILLSFAASAQYNELEKLNLGINTAEYDEISPVVSADGRTLYFTRVGSPDFVKKLMLQGHDISVERPDDYLFFLKDIYSQNTGTTIADPSKSSFNQDIWVAKSRDAAFDVITHPGPPLNNALPNSICAPTPMPNQYIVINQFAEEGGMSKGFSFIQEGPGGEWVFPQPMNVQNFHTKSGSVNMCLSSDAEVAILSLETNNTKGSNDLYISFREDINKWTEPKNMGDVINTGAKELTPFLSEDGTTLYFSSNRAGSAGTDIYYTNRLGDSWETWSTPQRMGPPINSARNESKPFLNDATGYFYFSSNRDGSSDIFRVKLKDAQKQEHVTVKGRIINSETNEMMSAKILSGMASMDFYKSSYLSNDGYFRVKMKKGEAMRFTAEKEGFISHVEEVQFDANRFYHSDYELDIIMDPLTVDAKISMKPIYFAQSKSTILQKSYSEVDRLAKLLKDNPLLHIRIEGHTDVNGKAKDLLELSEKRAKAIKQFLTKNGVEAERVSTKGFGGTRPISENTNELSRQKNRRVEVIITKVK